VDAIVARVPFVLLLVLSLTVHEYAHAWSAWKLGDDTASRAGRLTLNPLAHLDPIGTVLLPLLGIPFGWARPVPIDPSRFGKKISMGAGMAITASAGPGANIVLAVLAAVGIGLTSRFAPDAPEAWEAMIWGLLKVNVALAVFNLIPVPPLDGSRVVAWFIPTRMRHFWLEVERFAPFLLIFVFFFAGQVVSGPVNFLGGLLIRLAQLVA
jgi:Zn-dependent protease